MYHFKKKKKSKPKSKPKGWYVKKLDEVFSVYIRKKYSDEFGMTRCYTCDKRGHYKDFQNGHYISRGFMAARWEEQNCRVQCVGCNVFKNGNYTEYAARLVRDLGPDELERLNALKKVIKQWTIKELEEKIAYYKGLI